MPALVGPPQPKRKSKSKPRRRRSGPPVVTLSSFNCNYPVVSACARSLGWRVTDDEEAACNVMWVDNSLPIADVTSRVQGWQRVNHFPGMTNIARKSRLARNLRAMRKRHAAEFDFAPRTWVLPTEMSEFRSQIASGGTTFILKPDAGCQGRGIFLARTLEQVGQITPADPMVAQRYIRRPLLINGFKFDLRLYVLVTSCEPLRIYVFRDGLTRLATEAYVRPTSSNIAERRMHLTNYAVNKHAEGYVADNSDQGSKRSLAWFLTWVAEEFGEERRDEMWARIKDVCVKTLLSVQPTLRREYRSAFPDAADGDASRCFEVLGMDVMVDQALKPWLLEVNHLPSFACDAPLDRDIKSRLVAQTLSIIGAAPGDRRAHRDAEAARTRERLLASVAPPPAPGAAMDSPRRRRELSPATSSTASAEGEADDEPRAFAAAEEPGLVDFERAYPTTDRALAAKYDELLDSAADISEKAVLRFRAPLGQRRGEEMDLDLALPPLPNARPQDGYGRDCFGFRGTDRHGQYLTPAQRQRYDAEMAAQREQMERVMAKRRAARRKARSAGEAAGSLADEATQHGLKYRERKAAKQAMPTLAPKLVVLSF